MTSLVDVVDIEPFECEDSPRSQSLSQENNGQVSFNHLSVVSPKPKANILATGVSPANDPGTPSKKVKRGESMTFLEEFDVSDEMVSPTKPVSSHSTSKGRLPIQLDDISDLESSVTNLPTLPKGKERHFQKPTANVNFGSQDCSEPNEVTAFRFSPTSPIVREPANILVKRLGNQENCPGSPLVMEEIEDMSIPTQGISPFNPKPRGDLVYGRRNRDEHISPPTENIVSEIRPFSPVCDLSVQETESSEGKPACRDGPTKQSSSPSILDDLEEEELDD